MARPSRPWLRFYVETMHDPKLRDIPVAQRWVWVAVLVAARQSPVPGVLLVSANRPLSERALADLAAVPVRDVRAALGAFAGDDMIHRDEATEAWCVSNWASRQFESDDVTIRTRRHRSKEHNGNVPNPFPGTPPETETETETESPTSSSDSRPSPQAVDNVPQETWDAYAELMLRKAGNNVGNPVAWKASTALRARASMKDQAERWWHDFDLSARRLAECLADGQIRGVERRTVT